MADPNGNGLCSLAELETFVMKKLMAAYPKKNKTDPDVGRDLFDTYRPCYIRAFNDAKDYKADTGEVISGTKDATDDDFVSWEEFRFFNVYLIIYSAMFDAFAKLDGGGAGRDANDDLRLDMEEWLKGYTKVAQHGFVGLMGIDSRQEAEGVFNQIDDNGGGIVLMDEWCYYLKQEEIKAGTAVGALLNADETGGVGKQEKLMATKKALPGRVSAAEVQAKKERKAKKALAEASKRRGSGSKSAASSLTSTLASSGGGNNTAQGLEILQQRRHMVQGIKGKSNG